MEMSQYWVGQIPARPLSISVLDSYGRPFGASNYTSFKAVLVDPANRQVDVTGSTLDTGGKASGKFVFVWPTDKSLFTRPGDYLFQIEMSGTGVKDITSTHTIRVREVGRVHR